MRMKSLLPFLAAAVLWGQGPVQGGEPMRLLWTKDGQIVSDSYGMNELQMVSPKGSRTITLPGPRQTDFAQVDFSFYHDRMTSFVMDKAANYGTSGTLFESRDGKTWRRLARWQGLRDEASGKPLDRLRKVFQLDGNRFLLMGHFESGDEEPSRFAIGEITDTGFLREVRRLDSGMGFSKPTIQKTGNHRWDFSDPAHEMLFSAWLARNVLETEDHIILPAYHDALFLVFTRDGRFHGKAALFSDFEEGTRDQDLHDPIVLCAEPLKDGTILIATRTQEAVEKGQKDFPHSLKADRLWNPENLRNQDRSVVAYPDLAWWSFDPVNLRFTAMPSPLGVPTRFSNRAEMAAFYFRPKLDGSLEVHGFEHRR
jgi:hypothetical protein